VRVTAGLVKPKGAGHGAPATVAAE
jgi:hypothetical protein